MVNWRGPLLVAGVASLAVHVVLILNLDVEMPERNSPVSRTLEARLVPMKPAEPSIAPAAPIGEITAAAPKPKRKSPRRPPKPAEKTEVHPAPAPAETPASVAEASTEPPAPVESAASASAPAEAVPAKMVGTNPMPQRLVIRFVMNWGTDGLGVGRVQYRWARDGNRYELQSVAESTGVIDLLKSIRIQQTSLGEITENGLQPETFVFQNSARRTNSALFDWTEQSVKLVDSEKIETFPLPPGTQDIMSVLFQFAFVPPAADSIEFSVVTDRKLDSYRFVVVGEETLQMLLDDVKTLHIRRPKTETNDGLDVWLAKDRYFLPVKIIRSDRKDSRPIELVALEILVPPQEH